jgi:hypothetical protein
MGGTQSKSISEELNQLVTNVMADSFLECTSIASQSQMIELNKVTGNVTIENVNLNQGVSVDLSCVMQDSKKIDVANRVAQAIAQLADSKGEAVLSALGSTKAEATSKIFNELKNNINANTTTELSRMSNQTQGITDKKTIEGNVVIRGVTMVQGARETAASLMKTKAYSSVIDDAITKIDQKVAAMEKNPLAELISSIFSIPGMLIALGIGGLVVIILLFKLMGAGSSGSSGISPQEAAYVAKMAQKAV